MEYRIDTIDGIAVVHLRGAFDKSARGNIEMELLSMVRHGSKLVLDLSEVDFISSAGLHLILDLYRECNQQDAYLALTDLSESVRQILSITGIDSTKLPIYETLDEGLDALRSKTDKGDDKDDLSYEESSGAPRPPS